MGSPRIFIWFDVTLRDLIGEKSGEKSEKSGVRESGDERYVSRRRGRTIDVSALAKVQGQKPTDGCVTVRGAAHAEYL